MTRVFERSDTLDEITKIWNHFRRAARKIDNWNLGFAQPLEDAINCLVRHDLLTLRSGVHVAVHAREITKLANVDLKNLRPPATKRDRMLRQFLRKLIHSSGKSACRYDASA